MRKELEISASLPPSADTAKAEALLGGLGHVTAWEEPTKKGKRVFDDADFYNSVATQFAVKQRLSEAQMRVLERMFLNYKEQIPGADKTIATHDIKVQTRKTRKPRGKNGKWKINKMSLNFKKIRPYSAFAHDHSSLSILIEKAVVAKKSPLFMEQYYIAPSKRQSPN